MSEKDQDHERAERLLRRARPTEPSELLKARVTEAARAAWEPAPSEVPWQIPMWRLAVSAAAAAIIIAFGNHLGDFAWPEVTMGRPIATEMANPELEELAEMVYGSSRNRLGTRRRGLKGPEAVLRDRVEGLELMLDEMESHGEYGQPTRSGGRSRLLRRSHLGWYS